MCHWIEYRKLNITVICASSHPLHKGDNFTLLSCRRLQGFACHTCHTLIFPFSTSQILNLWHYCCYSHCKCQSFLLADGRKQDEGDDDDYGWGNDNNDDDDNAWQWGWRLLQQCWGSQKWPRLLSWQTRKQEMKSSSKTYLINTHFIIPIIRITVFRNTFVHTSLKEK